MDPLVREYFDLMGMATIVKETMRFSFEKMEEDGLVEDPTLHAKVKNAMLSEGVDALSEAAGKIIGEVYQPKHLAKFIEFLKTEAGRHIIFNGHMIQERIQKTARGVGETIIGRVIEEHEKEAREWKRQSRAGKKPR